MVTTRSQSRVRRSSCGCSYRGTATKAGLVKHCSRVLLQSNPRYRAAVLSAMKNAAKSGASKVTSKVTEFGDTLLQKGYELASKTTKKECMDEARVTFETELKKDSNFCEWDRAKKFGIVLAAGLRAGIVFLALYQVGIAQSVYSFLQSDYFGWLTWIVTKAVEYTFGLCAYNSVGWGAMSNSFLGYIPFLKSAAYAGDMLTCGVVVAGITLALDSTIAKVIKLVIEKVAKIGVRAARSVHEVMNTIPYLRPVYLAHVARTMTLPNASPEAQKEYDRYVGDGGQTNSNPGKSAAVPKSKKHTNSNPGKSAVVEEKASGRSRR